MLRKTVILILIAAFVCSPLAAFAIAPALSGTLIEDFSYPEGTLLNTTALVAPSPAANWTTGWWPDNKIGASPLTTPGAPTPTPAMLANDYIVKPQGSVSHNYSFAMYRGFGSFVTLNGDYDYYMTWKQSIGNVTTNNGCGAAMYFLYGPSSPNFNTRIGFASTASTTDTELIPYLAMQGATAVYGTENIIKGTTYVIKLKLSSRSSDRTVRASMKYYADGSNEPTDWQLSNSSTAMYGWAFYALGLSGNTYVTNTPITFGGIFIEKYVGLTAVESAITNAKLTKTQSDYDAALALVNSLPVGMAKNLYNNDLVPILAYINQQKQLILDLALQVEALEAMAVTTDSYSSVQQSIDDANLIANQITSTDSVIQNQKTALMQRILSIQKNVYTVAIIQTKATERFDYADGTKLNSTAASNNWSSGWMADQALSIALSDNVVVNGGEYLANTNAYRGFLSPISVSPLKDYYLQFSVKANLPQSGQWAGISLGNKALGICDAGLFADAGAGKVPDGNFQADTWYNILLKITGQGRLLYKAWQKSAIMPVQWIDAGAVTGTYGILGLNTNVPGTYFDDIIKEQYPQGYADELITRINNIAINFNQTALNTALQEANAMPSCLARDNVFAQIAYVQQLIDAENERLNQISATNAVITAEGAKTVSTVNAAQAAIEILTDAAVKNALKQRLVTVTAYINLQTPTVELAAIEDNNGSLKGIYTVNDIHGNGVQSKLRWYSGSNVISQSDTLDNASSYAGSSVVFEVTPLNSVGKEGTPYVSRPYKIPQAKTGGSYSGGGGGAVYLPITPIPTPIEEKKPEEISEIKDINGHWASEDIAFLVKKGIAKGNEYKQFLPEKSITRAEFTAMLVRTVGLETIEYKDQFKDISQSDWFANSISSAVKAGLASGDGVEFRPNQSITRQEAAKLLVMACRLLKVDIKKSEKAFTDSSSISQWATDYVGLAVGAELIKGMEDGSFKPLSNTTRAQASALIHRLLEKR